ncbi:MAG: NADH-quinone oxidoreductase subunit L [Acidobacteriota bacterium]|nr:NADH-quinone oxidoreductase subunit L [Acidobacteriota bacterium]
MLLLIPLLPFAGFLINATLGRRLSRGVSGAIASGVMLAAFGVSAAVVFQMLGQTPDAAGGMRAIEHRVFTWIASGDLFVPFTLRVDPLSSVMILVITGIGSLIHIYSTAYMHDEPAGEYARYFSYLNLFAAFMLVLVLGASFPVMFVGWEGVGLCSYLLIGFWFKKKSASDAGKKAFIVNRIGDFGFILGMLLIFVTFGTLSFQDVNALAAAMPVEHSMGVLTIATLLLFVGATGKSAQIPLYTWLPDAMEGPTPVSALIHAATMVTAGVYMIGRNAVLFGHADITMQVIAVVGIATALMAGTIALVQNDIKRVLAYSTVSQLGYMFVAMGVGAYGAGIFHLYTHAFFKALLFLGSGAVIHALHGEQDIRNMGGLRKKLPVTYWTFLIGTIAIAGVPFFSGFFSKDEILWKTYASGHYVIWIVGMITSLLTATYMFRLVFLTFHGERRHDAPAAAPAHGTPDLAGGPVAHEPHDAHAHAAHGVHVAHGDDAHGAHHGDHLHDAPPAMAIPLIVLAIGSILAGYVGVPHALGGHNLIEGYLEPAFHAVAPVTPAQSVTAEGHDSLAPAAVDSETHAAAAVPHEVAAEPAHAAEGDHSADIRTERMLMGLSTLVAFSGIGLAALLWLKRPRKANLQTTGIHRILESKYYVDELYDAAVVRPIHALSQSVLWKGVDAGVIDGAVNGTGSVIRASSGVLRRLQTGSIRTYATALFLGVVTMLGYYLWR